MSALYVKLHAEIRETASNAHRTLRSLLPEIKQAEALAEKLRSAGVSAYATGAAEWLIPTIWVEAEPRSAEALDEALTRIDVRETSRTYLHQRTQARYMARLEGYHCDLCVRIPQPCEPN